MVLFGLLPWNAKIGISDAGAWYGYFYELLLERLRLPLLFWAG